MNASLGISGRIDRRGLLRAGWFFLLTTLNAEASAHGLAGSEWRPARLGSISLAGGSPLFVQFKADGKLLICGGCNYLSGTYRVAQHEIILSSDSAASSACASDAAHVEELLLEALRTTRRFVRRRAALSLFNSDGGVTAEFVQTDWD